MTLIPTPYVCWLCKKPNLNSQMLSRTIIVAPDALPLEEKFPTHPGNKGCISTLCLSPATSVCRALVTGACTPNIDCVSAAS